MPQMTSSRLMLRPSWPYGDLAAHAPERPRQELLLQRAVPVAFVEVRAQIVTLEIRENVLDEKGLRLRHLERRIAASIGDEAKERSRRGIQAVEDPAIGS